MNALGIAWFVTTVGLIGGAQISVQQAQYYDGDSDAHWRRMGKTFNLLHQPKHPQAVRAMRRGRILAGLGFAALIAGFIAKGLS